MNRQTSTTRALALLLTFLLVFGSMAGCGTKKNAAPAGAKTVTLTVVHGDGSTKEISVKTDAATLGEALLAENIIAGEESQYGLFVKTVDGETADDGNQEWWCLTKGGEDVMTGVDSTDIADGEAYEFTLTVGW